MIINLVSNLNKILPLGNLINENLTIIKAMRENGIDAVKDTIRENMDFKEYLKFRFLNSIKDSIFVETQIRSDNQKILNFVNDMSPALKDVVLENFFQHDSRYGRVDGIPVDNQTAMQDFFKTIDYKQDMHRVIENPFTGNNIKTLITSNMLVEDEKKYNESHLQIDAYKMAAARPDDLHRMTIELCQVAGAGIVNFEKIKDIKPLEISFNFTMYHELAHAGYSQMSRKSYTRNEKNSDLSAIIKIIKNYDFDQNESQQLCDNCLNYRVSSAAMHEYKSLDCEQARIHYTEDAIMILKQIIKTDLDTLKKLPDKEIPRYAEFIIDEIPSFTANIDSSMYMNKFEESYKANAPDGSNPEVIAHDIDKIKYKASKDPEIFNDIIINHLLTNDFIKGKEEILKAFDFPYLSEIVNNKYALYQQDKILHSNNLEKNFDSQLIKSKMSRNINNNT